MTITLNQKRHILQKRKEGQDVEEQIKVLETRRDRLLIELELLSAHYPADSGAEE